jgi:replication factor C small subunit
MNWTEKYRPQRVSDIRGQTKFVSDANSWIERGDMPNVLIYGNPGNGKTTAGHCLANEFLGDGKSVNFIEINASQDRKLDTIRNTISNFANTKGTTPFKICMLDEIDGMTRDSQRALKRVMERATNVRFIITCNEHSDVDYAIRSRCANYWFEPLPYEDMYKMLWYISIEENFKVNDDDLLEYCKAINGDMRRGINELQACAFSGTDIIEKSREFLNNYTKIMQHITKKEVFEANDLLMKEVLSGRSVKEICNNLHHCVLDMEIDRSIMFKCLSHIGEMEWRSKSMTPKIIVSWFSAQFIDN